MPGHPYPDESSLDVALSNWAVEALMLNGNFVANRIAPPVSVDNIASHYFVFVPEEGLNVEHHEKLGKGGVATEMDFRIDKGFYSTEESAKRHLITDREVKNSSPAAADYIKGDKLLLQNVGTIREFELAEQILNPANYFGGAGGSHVIACVDAWDTDDGDPKTEIDNAVRAVMLDSGFYPNKLVVPPLVYNALTSNETIREIMKYLGGLDYLKTGRIPNDHLWNLDVVNAGAIYDTNGPLETAALRFLWEQAGAVGDNWAIVMYVDPIPSKKSGTFVSQFAFNMNRISDQDIVSFYVYRDEHRRGEWREVRTDYQVKITNNRAAAIITDVITPGTSG